jgi:hypothetical protein
MKTLMNSYELEQAFRAKGYRVIKVKYSKTYNETTVVIRDRDKLAEASEFGRSLGVTVATPI